MTFDEFMGEEKSWSIQPASLHFEWKVDPVAVEKFSAKVAQANEWQKQVYGQMLVHDPMPITEPAPLTSAMFEDAVAHIDTHGWLQGANVDNTGAVCARGALGLFTRSANVVLRFTCDIDRVTAVDRRMAEVMDLMGIPTSFGSVMGWNDHPGRTKDEVIDALMLGAKTLRDLGR